MTREENYLIKLIYSYLNGVEIGESGDIEWESLYNTAHFHGIANFTYYALEHYKVQADEAVKTRLFLEHEDYVGIEAIQELEIQNILDIFEEEGICAMPMKGYVLKNMYPVVDMREMCDVDMLIKEADYGAIKAIMEENGFVFKEETPHEYVFYKGDMLNIEFHKCVVPPYNHRLYAYYGDGWDMAKLCGGKKHIYELGTEDFYVYNLVHTAKHYLNSGIGIRQALDLWIIRHKNPDMDFGYIDEQIEKLGLTRFKEVIHKLIQRWFDGEQVDNAAVDGMEEFILKCGVRGEQRQEKISQMYKNVSDGSECGEGYKSYLLKAFFPSVDMISLKYPVVKRCILAYPFCWVHRLVKNLLFERKKLRNKFAKEGIKNSEVEEFSHHCELVGLRNDL